MRTPSKRYALASLTSAIEDMVRDYDPPRDYHDRIYPDSRHFAAYMAERMAEHGEQAEESGECCPLCDVVREAELERVGRAVALERRGAA